MKACSLESPASLLFAAVTISSKLPLGAFHERFSLYNSADFKDPSIVACQLRSIVGNTPEEDMDYMKYLSDFLHDPKRSREVCARPILFAQAARHCLLYLCNHTAYQQKAPPQMSPKQRMRRKYAPWKWRRRVLRQDIRASGTTPWFWLRPFIRNDDELSRRHVLHRKTNDLIYVHTPHSGHYLPNDDPVVMYRVNSEKYHLALIYLNQLLPRALPVKLDNLVGMCQRLTLASLSQNFPRQSAQARSNMQEYAARWG